LRAAHGTKEKFPVSMPNLPSDFVRIVTAPPTTKRIVGESANGVTEEGTKPTNVTRKMATNQRPKELWN
jgi:hypothetical protein